MITDTPQADAPVRLWRQGGIAHLRFNRPASLNAIDLALARAFLEGCRQLAEDKQVRVVVISAEGRAFMAGGDIASMRADPVGGSSALIEQMHPALEILAQLPAPVIASVHGAVAGAGLGVALACDLVIAAAGTRFNLAYPRIGTSCDCSTSWGLVRAVGARRAMEIALLNDVLEADEAQRMGLINRVVVPEALAEQTAALAQRIEQSAPLAMARLKRLVREADRNDLHTQLKLEARLFRECAASADFVEGMASFVEKRPARFEGL